ncbi:MAG TPA: galactokinase [Polyangiaceae bacterium]|jgi:galactokinase|nr:galactokinase [Polyangiaceae bacterium]
MVDLEQLETRFVERYGARPRIFSAPGRVNLIGEHTDYNEGFVLPLAIERRTFVAASPRSDGRISAFSEHAESAIEFELASPGAKRQGSWRNYVEGTAQALLNAGFAVEGANLLIASDVPAGAGLSASAALELAIGLALVCLAGNPSPDRVKLALAGQAAEHTYVGTLCGIMDQYVVALGQAEHALLIDCRSLEFSVVPFELGSACLLICDTRVKHELSSSAYNERRQQCEIGVSLLARSLPHVRALRDVSLAELERAAAQLPPLIARRCRHVVGENARTLEAAELLEAGRLVELGKLMCASHASLRDDYEVSCAELDECVAAASEESGVYGSRMTGGGFGGCTVTLLERAALERVQTAITRRFTARFGKAPEFLVTGASAGAREA